MTELALVDPLSGAGKTAPPLGEVLDFMRLLWGLDQALETASKRMERTSGVTSPQRLVLRLVGRFPGITANRLAGILRVHPSTVSGIVKRLEHRGLVERGCDARDRRRAYLGLTARGRQLDCESAATVEAAVQRTLASAAPPEIEHTRRVLAALAQELS
jgi:MarR family transcriptional regulator, organic hydroperoxide resistance regulator